MKHLATLALVVVLFVALTGVASAAKPVEGTFTIRGYTTGYTYETLPNGRTSYHLNARSSGASAAEEGFCQYIYGMACQATCATFAPNACGVSGYFNGQFTFEEWGTVDIDPVTGEGSGRGKNRAVLTLLAPNGKVVAELNGKVDTHSSSGKFKLQQKDGTGTYRGLDGNGDYSGDVGMIFSVTFTGKFR